MRKEAHAQAHGKQARARRGLGPSLSAPPGARAGTEPARRAQAESGWQQHGLMKKNDSVLCWLVAITSSPLLLTALSLALLAVGFVWHGVAAPTGTCSPGARREGLHRRGAAAAGAGVASCEGRAWSWSIRIRFGSSVGFCEQMREQVGARNDCVKK